MSSRARPALLFALAVVLYLAPFAVGTEYRLFIATQMAAYVLVAVGLNLLNGYGGQVSLGHGALVAIGAYAVAIAMVDHHWSFWPAALLAMLAASAVGAVMALPAFRLSTWYFALITLGFAEVVGGLLTEWRELTHGFAGVVGVPKPVLFGHELSSLDLYWLALTLNILALAGMANLLASRFGRALVGVRDNPVAATASGVSLVRIKMLAFVVSAAMAGLAGALFAVQKTVVTPDDFTADFSIFFLLMVVLGGAGRLWGPVVGAVVFFLVPELLAALQSWRMLIYGTALLFLMLYAPHGLVGAIEAGWQLLRKRLGLPTVVPPPLVAASRQSVEPVAGAALVGAGRREAFRRRDGAGRRQPRGRRRHHPRDRRAQRLGQDDPAQHDLRLLSDRCRIDPGRRPVGHRPRAAPHRAPWRRPHLPDAAHAAGAERARQRAARRLSGRARRAPCRRRCACRSRAESKPRRSAMRWAISTSSASPIARSSRPASCRTASSGWPRSPAPWSAARACCCSTSRPPACRSTSSIGSAS